MSADQITPLIGNAGEDEIADVLALGKYNLHSQVTRVLHTLSRDRDTLRAEVQRLTSWKQEAVEVQNGLQLQEIGQAIGAKLGTDIGPQVLPWILAKKAEVQRLTEEARRSDAGRVDIPDLSPDGMSDAQFVAGYRFAQSRSRLSPSPQPATGAVVIRDPDDDDWDAFGFQQGTKAEVLRVWNRALATCKNSLQVPQPSADVVVVLDRVAACARDFQDRQRNLTVSRDSWGFFQSDSALESALKSLDALRSSTNHDAQDAGEG